MAQWLKMYIGNILIQRVQLDYCEMESCDEIQGYQERIAKELYEKHINKIRESELEPLFFIDSVQSRMNDIDFKLLPDYELVKVRNIDCGIAG